MKKTRRWRGTSARTSRYHHHRFCYSWRRSGNRSEGHLDGRPGDHPSDHPYYRTYARVTSISTLIGRIGKTGRTVTKTFQKICWAGPASYWTMTPKKKTLWELAWELAPAPALIPPLVCLARSLTSWVFPT